MPPRSATPAPILLTDVHGACLPPCKSRPKAASRRGTTTIFTLSLRRSMNSRMVRGMGGDSTQTRGLRRDLPLSPPRRSPTELKDPEAFEIEAVRRPTRVLISASRGRVNSGK
jgi:hypothetical protein